MESSWIVAYYHTLHLTLSYFVCCVCIFWRGYVDRIKKKEKKITGKKKKSEATNSRFPGDSGRGVLPES